MDLSQKIKTKYILRYHSNSFQKQRAKNTVCGGDKLHPSPQLLSLHICILSVRWPLPDFSPLRQSLRAFLKASCCIFTSSPTAPPKAERTIPQHSPPGSSTVCSPALGHKAAHPRMPGSYPHPARWHRPIDLWHALHTHCRKTWAHQLHEDRDHVWDYPSVPLQRLAHSVLNEHL